jgi:histidine transport system substrate-binding protein
MPAQTVRVVRQAGITPPAAFCVSPIFVLFDSFDTMRKIALNITSNIAYKAAMMVALGLTLLSGTAYAKDWKTIRFGVDPSYPPFESKAADGSFKGFDIDLGNALCAEMHAKCTWVEQSFDGMISALKARKFDAILSSLSVTEGRKKKIAFSDKLFDAPIRLVARSGSGLMPTAKSLQGKRVGVQQGTDAEAYAKAYWQKGGVTIVPYQDQQQVYADLVNGRLDAVLQDRVQAEVGFLKTPSGNGYSFAGPLLNDAKIIGDGTAIGLRKGDKDLKAKFDAAIAELHKSGKFKQLNDKYFSFDICTTCKP